MDMIVTTIKPPERPNYLERFSAVNTKLECKVNGCTGLRNSASYHCCKHAHALNRWGHPLAKWSMKNWDFSFERRVLTDVFDLNIGADSVQKALKKMERILASANCTDAPDSLPELRIFQGLYDSKVSSKKLLFECALWVIIADWQKPNGYIKNERHRLCMIGDVFFRESGIKSKDYNRCATNRTAIANFIMREYGGFFGAILSASNARKAFILGEQDALAESLVSN